MKNNYPNIDLGGIEVNRLSRPYIIAEIGVNHEGSLQSAKQMIELAKEGGANAAKFQSYKAHLIASKNSPSYWDLNKEGTTSQYHLFQKYDSFNEADYQELASHCKIVGIDFISTPFDLNAVSFLDPLVPFFKIASADITNIPLLRRVARTKKPIVLSTGAANLDEIGRAVKELEAYGCNDLALLHCILNYPTQNSCAHLRMIKGLSDTFPGKVIGYSDHTLPNESMDALVAAFLMGAVIIEKHFTDDKSKPGNDHYHSMDVGDLRRFVDKITVLIELLGDEEIKTPIANEEISRKNARRSIFLSKNVLKGQKLTESDLICKRPGVGISPLSWDELIGSTVTQDLPEDAALTWDVLLREAKN